MTPRLPFFILGLSVLGACASVPTPEGPPVSSAADRHTIDVTQAVQSMEVAAAPGQMSLDGGSRARLNAFANDYLRYGHGPLVLETPSGGANAEAASMVAADTRRALLDAGVSYAAIAGSTRSAEGDASPILVSFERYHAQAPECAPIWEQDLAHQSNNQPWASFGCATNANLAAMVEDPADLLRPREADARDGGRRDNVMEAYREGDVTHAARSNDERIQISNAVQ